jgi:hypothetical protein
MKILSLTIALSFPVVAAANPWTLVDCAQKSAEVAQMRAERGLASPSVAWPRYVQTVKRAKPGEARYVPHPYPNTDDQVIADFRFAYFERLFESIAEAPEEEQPIYRGLEAGTLTLEVVRVENWSTTRCILDRAVPFFHVVTVLGEEGRPLSRAALHSSGILSSYSRLSSTYPTGLLRLEVVSDILSHRYGLDLPVQAPQYVALGGMPNDCGPLSPCIAFRSAQSSYILGRSGEALYELPTNGLRRSVQARREEFAGRGLVLGQKEYRNPWLSVGFEWVQAELIAGQDSP